MKYFPKPGDTFRAVFRKKELTQERIEKQLLNEYVCIDAKRDKNSGEHCVRGRRKGTTDGEFEIVMAGDKNNKWKFYPIMRKAPVVCKMKFDIEPKMKTSGIGFGTALIEQHKPRITVAISAQQIGKTEALREAINSLSGIRFYAPAASGKSEAMAQSILGSISISEKEEMLRRKFVKAWEEAYPRTSGPRTGYNFDTQEFTYRPMQQMWSVVKRMGTID